jgi:phosphatidate cytidylyltransferase
MDFNMSNTQLRIISAIVLAAIVATVAYLGIKEVLIFLTVVGIICVDEIHTNFVQKDRGTPSYFIAEVAFVVPFVYLNLIDRSFDLNYLLVNAGLILNTILLFYLFMTKIESERSINFLRAYSFTLVALVLFPMGAVASILYYGKWLSLLVVLLFINFGMDTGAWFFGKRFGKTKLWPKVSPNKTIEGLLGGAFVSAILGTLMWNLLVGYNGLKYFLFFMVLGLLSQTGDLVQSKLKRQFGIKDSSQLIPGHGGVYDRIDSLVFVAPFYATFVNYLNL